VKSLLVAVLDPTVELISDAAIGLVPRLLTDLSDVASAVLAAVSFGVGDARKVIPEELAEALSPLDNVFGVIVATSLCAAFVAMVLPVVAVVTLLLLVMGFVPPLPLLVGGAELDAVSEAWLTGGSIPTMGVPPPLIESGP
jgi:hypothetical protein